MKHKLDSRLAVCSWLCFIGLVGLISCSQSVRAPFVMPVQFAAAFEAEKLVGNVSLVELTVSAEDMVEIVDTLAVLNGRVRGEVDVPPGMERIFTLEAFDEQGVLLYQGSDTADVGLGEDLVVTIRMIPQVLMLKVDPLFKLIDMTTYQTGYFDIYVYNAQNLFGASFRVSFDPTIIDITTVELGDFLGAEPLSLLRQEADYVAIALTRLRGQTGVNGSGRLARINYQLLGEGQCDLEFDPQTARLGDPDDNPVAGSSSLALENGVLLVMVPLPD